MFEKLLKLINNILTTLFLIIAIGFVFGKAEGKTFEPEMLGLVYTEKYLEVEAVSMAMNEDLKICDALKPDSSGWQCETVARHKANFAMSKLVNPATAFLCTKKHETFDLQNYRECWARILVETQEYPEPEKD